jgi:hypothetical protein
MAIEHGMNGAFGGKWDVGEAAQQSLADFPSAPTGMLTLHVQDVVLHLKGELVGIAIGTSASVGEPVNAAFLIAIEDLVAGLARDPELSAQIRHGFARESASYELNSLIHNRTLLPRHPLSSPKGEKV